MSALFTLGGFLCAVAGLLEFVRAYSLLRERDPEAGAAAGAAALMGAVGMLLLVMARIDG